MSAFEKRGGRPDGEDDGRTIADMSMLDDRPSFRAAPGDVPGERPENAGQSWADSSPSRKERLLVALGALKAGLLIAAVYIVVFGVVIWLMLRFWL